jgi:hypothetical protein
MFPYFTLGEISSAICQPIVAKRAMLLGNTNILPEMFLHFDQCCQAMIISHILPENVHLQAT